MNTLDQIKQHFVEQGLAENFDSETEATYKTAIDALTDEYINVADLPVENDWYKTLWAVGLIDMQTRPLFYAGSPRGYKIDYKLKEVQS